MRTRINLHEGLSPILYHLTSLVGAGEIVTSNRFRLSASFSNTSELSVGSSKKFFLSTSRLKAGGYTVRTSMNQSVVFVLDGRKLAHNYSGGPVQYWDRGMIDIDYRYDEQEDRVYNDKPYINDALGYIKEAHVLIKPKSQGSYMGLSLKGRKALLALKQSGIPVYLYDDQNAFITQNTKEAKPLSSFDIPKAEPEDYERHPTVDRRATIKQTARRDRQAGRNPKMAYDLTRWVEFMTRPVSQYDRLGYDRMHYLQLIIHGHPDPINMLSADLHNAKNNPDELRTIANIMQRYKLKSAQDILNFIKKRWEPVLH